MQTQNLDQLRQQVLGDELTPEQVKALATAFKDIVTVLADADPADKERVARPARCLTRLRPRRDRDREVGTPVGYKYVSEGGS